METVSSDCVLSRPREGVHAFSSQADADVDKYLMEEPLSSSPSSPDSPPPCLPMTIEWQDSHSDCVPKEMEAILSAALSSRSLTPLLKEELRCKIQLRRLQHGEEEMTADFSTKQSAMSLEEVAKKNKKMQQNRVSAQRSRERQKSLEKTIKSRLELLQNENKLLLEQAQSLRHACHVARNWLHQHRACIQRTNIRSCSSCDSPVLPLSGLSSSSVFPLSGLPSVSVFASSALPVGSQSALLVPAVSKSN